MTFINCSAANITSYSKKLNGWRVQYRAAPEEEPVELVMTSMADTMGFIMSNKHLVPIVCLTTGKDVRGGSYKEINVYRPDDIVIDADVYSLQDENGDMVWVENEDNMS